MAVAPSMRRSFGIFSNTYMVQIALKMMGQPYTQIWPGVDQVDLQLKKNSAPLLQSTVLERQRGLTFPMNRPVLSRKSIQSVTIWPMPLASLTTTAYAIGSVCGNRCKWWESGWVLMSSKASMQTIKVASVSWKSDRSHELNQVHISVENMALIKQGFYQVANGTSGLTTGKNRWSWGQCAHQCKDWYSWNHCRWGANKPLY